MAFLLLHNYTDFIALQDTTPIPQSLVTAPPCALEYKTITKKRKQSIPKPLSLSYMIFVDFSICFSLIPSALYLLFYIFCFIPSVSYSLFHTLCFIPSVLYLLFYSCYCHTFHCRPFFSVSYSVSHSIPYSISHSIPYSISCPISYSISYSITLPHLLLRRPGKPPLLFNAPSVHGASCRQPEHGIQGSSRQLGPGSVPADSLQVHSL